MLPRDSLHDQIQALRLFKRGRPGLRDPIHNHLTEVALPLVTRHEVKTQTLQVEGSRAELTA